MQTESNLIVLIQIEADLRALYTHFVMFLFIEMKDSLYSLLFN